jgi:glutathione transport system ATP-binding protein
MSSPALALPDGRVLAVDDLTVRFSTSERTVDAVKKLSFHVDHGETLAVVGESGSGKSVTSLALMRLWSTVAAASLAGAWHFGAATAKCSTWRRRATRRCATSAARTSR